MNTRTVAQPRDIFQFVARNADIADAHQFSRDHKKVVNRALTDAGLPTLGGRATQTMGHLRTLVHGAEVVATRPERIAHEPVTKATPAQVAAQGWEPSIARRTPKARKVGCNGVNLSASSANEHCARKVTLSAGERPTEAFCHDHEGQRGRDYDALVWERTRNIWQAEREREEYLARKEALRTLAEINA